MLCYSRSNLPGVGFEDILEISSKLYPNGTQLKAAEKAVKFIQNQRQKQKQGSDVLQYDIVDPFVGRGTIGRKCLDSGMAFLGLDVDKVQCDMSRKFLQKQT